MKFLSYVSILCLTTIASCTTTSVGRLQEPMRTQNYLGCIMMAGIPVTACQCIETKMFELFGNESDVIEKGYSDPKVLFPMIEECTQDLLPEIEKNTRGVM